MSLSEHTAAELLPFDFPGRQNLISVHDTGLKESEWENTMESVSQLAKKAIELEPVERIRLVEAILHSLDKLDHDIERSWVAESEARYVAYKRGELDAIDWEEIKKRHER